MLAHLHVKPNYNAVNGLRQQINVMLGQFIQDQMVGLPTLTCLNQCPACKCMQIKEWIISRAKEAGHEP